MSRKILSLFLTLAILVSSSGVVLASHICLAKPVSHVSLFTSEDCCSKKSKSCNEHPAPVASFEKKCCLMKISFHQVKLNGQVKSFTFFNYSFITSPVHSVFSCCDTLRSVLRSLAFRGPPVIFTGSGLIHFIHSLLI